MPGPRQFTDAEDDIIRSMHAKRYPRVEIAKVIGCARDTITIRMRVLSIDTSIAANHRVYAQRDPPKQVVTDFRAPLPPGDPISWGAISQTEYEFRT